MIAFLIFALVLVVVVYVAKVVIDFLGLPEPINKIALLILGALALILLLYKVQSLGVL